MQTIPSHGGAGGIVGMHYLSQVSCPVGFFVLEGLFSLQQNNFGLCGQAFASFQHGLFMSKPCWKLVKACPQSQKLFCCRENNLLVLL